ncbi:MAG: nitroreductase family protein [Bacteroidia bacterium]
MSNQINKIIKERRSIYPLEFTGKIIEESIVECLLENANYAPNHHSNYPWRFVVLEKSIIEDWMDCAIDIYKRETPIEKIKESKLRKLEAYKSKISNAIAIVLNQDFNDGSKEVENICAVAASVQNMYLSLSQFRHVGGYWSTGLGTYSREMHGFLNLEIDQKLLGFFIIGHVTEKRVDANRKDIRSL